jgi:CheY-like chemotaxis protein
MPEEPILVVDDNPLNLKLTRLLLATEGYQVRTAERAEEAFAVLQGFHPRLILMDIQLPGIDGLELTRQLRADPSFRDVTILAVTAYAMKSDERRARDAGCDGYIAKPIDTRSLPDLVRAYLNGSVAGHS